MGVWGKVVGPGSIPQVLALPGQVLVCSLKLAKVFVFVLQVGVYNSLNLCCFSKERRTVLVVALPGRVEHASTTTRK